MTQQKHFELLRYVPHLLRFVVLFAALGVGFTWYNAQHAGAPPKPVGTIDWNRVLVAGVCGLLAEGVFQTLLFLWEKRVRR